MKRPFHRRGSIMALFLLLLPVLILMVGFSVDFAHMQKVRTELRRSTDLAAKAAAVVLSDTADESQARQTAKDVALLNRVHGSPLTLVDSQIVFGAATQQPNGSWSFQAGAVHPNAVQIFGQRTNTSADGNVSSFFGSFYGRAAFEPQFTAVGAFINSDICLVLDRSSSMKLPTSSNEPLMSTGDARFCQKPLADSRWVALEAAVNVFLAELDKTRCKERVAVVTFASDYTSCSVTSSKVTIDQSLVSDTNLVRTTMANKKNEDWNGMTDIAAGIIAGQGVLSGPGSRANARKFLVVLTDGQFTEANPNTAAQAAADAGSVIFTLTFSDGANQTHMQNVAQIGNGRHFHAATPEQLEAAFRELGGSLANLVQ
ncbi:MAG: VWA domain-containing protein [Planctomycetales bacterium]|nr:VWA domain-containing protein [Planctomycetales bacterium]